MIPLFHINEHTVYTTDLGNHLHGPIVDEFVENFCNYVGADYGCAVNSATNAIFLAFENQEELVTVPSMLPPVVVNSLYHAGQQVQYSDDVDWVGGSYELHNFGSYKIIDSAQRVDRDQFKNEANDNDLMIFSFYPTKPVGGIDGGIIVSNDKERIDYFKQRSMNGMSSEKNSWDRKQLSLGWKMYMNSFQAYIANKNLATLDEKYSSLHFIRKEYNEAFGLQNTSNHLYRINVEDRDKVRLFLDRAGISTGIHYEPLHKQDFYSERGRYLPKVDEAGRTTLSIPFHEHLTKDGVQFIIDQVKHATL